MKASSHRSGSRLRFLSSTLKGLLAFAVIALVLWCIAWSAAKLLLVSAPLAHADAIIVLAGSTVFEERTQRAVELFKEGRAAKIVLTNDNMQSGWVSGEQRNIPYHELASRMLSGSDVPRDAIEILPQPVSSTHEEALLLRQYAEAKHLNSILVVTSGYHSRRALWTMRKVFAGSGIIVGLEAVRPGLQSARPGLWWLHRRGWELVPGEYVKMVYYWLRFG